MQQQQQMRQHNQQKQPQPQPQSALFLESENVQMMWDIIKEAKGSFSQIDGRNVMNAMQQFNSYNSIHSSKLSLMEINKKFIEIFLAEQKNVLMVEEPPPLKLNPPRETPRDAPREMPRELYTAKDIQTERQTEFEKNMNKKRLEFDSVINIEKPPMPNFSEKMDTPISEMESLIAETIAQRNFEISQIQLAQEPTTHAVHNSNNTAAPIRDTSSPITKNVTMNMSQNETFYQNRFEEEQEQQEISRQEKETEQQEIKQVIKLSPPNDDNIFLRLKKVQPPSIQDQIDDLNNKINSILDAMVVMNTAINSLKPRKG